MYGLDGCLFGKALDVILGQVMEIDLLWVEREGYQ